MRGVAVMSRMAESKMSPSMNLTGNVLGVELNSWSPKSQRPGEIHCRMRSRV